jgi:hypothetical protein
MRRLLLNPILLIDALLFAALVLILSSCTSVPAVNCESADKVRAAAVLTIEAIDRVCPMRGAWGAVP